MSPKPCGWSHTSDGQYVGNSPVTPYSPRLHYIQTSLCAVDSRSAKQHILARTPEPTVSSQKMVNEIRPKAYSAVADAPSRGADELVKNSRAASGTNGHKPRRAGNNYRARYGVAEHGCGHIGNARWTGRSSTDAGVARDQLLKFLPKYRAAPTRPCMIGKAPDGLVLHQRHGSSLSCAGWAGAML